VIEPTGKCLMLQLYLRWRLTGRNCNIISLNKVNIKLVKTHSILALALLESSFFTQCVVLCKQLSADSKN